MPDPSFGAVLFTILWICFQSAYSIPTFTNEYVHIKLHLPEEVSDELVRNIQEIQHSALEHIPYHKVIHHYHHKHYFHFKPHVKHVDSNAETYVVKHAPKLKQNVQTLKIIEEKFKTPHDHNHHHHHHEHSETFKVIELPSNHDYDEHLNIIDTKPKPPPFEETRYSYHEQNVESNQRPVVQTDTIEVAKPEVPLLDVDLPSIFAASSSYKDLKDEVKLIATTSKNITYQPTKVISKDKYPLLLPSSIYELPQEEKKNFAPANEYNFARDEDLLSEILEATKNKTPTGYDYSPPKTSPNNAINGVAWSKEGNTDVGENHNAAETYSGVDSYSVNHVQGVGSGGYDYHSPFLRK